jgi:hypothetical protein
MGNLKMYKTYKNFAYNDDAFQIKVAKALCKVINTFYL